MKVLQNMGIPNGPIKGRPYHLPNFMTAGLYAVNFSMPALRE